MGRNRVKEWNGMRGSGCYSSGGLKAGNAGTDVLNEIFTSLDALGLRRFGGAKRW